MPALVCSRSTSLTPLALVATIRVMPWASCTLVPTASSSTSLPIGTEPGWRADQRVVGLARGHLLRRGGPDVEPDRGVEAEDLVDERVGELVLEDLGVLGGGEVAVLPAGCHVDAHDPVHELLQAPLALRRADRAAEVLGGHDVGGVDRPEVGELHAVLLEVDRAVPPVGHDDVAALPGDLVIGVDAFAGVDAADGESLAGTLAAVARDPLRRLGHVRPPSGSGWSVAGLARPCACLPACYARSHRADARCSCFAGLRLRRDRHPRGAPVPCSPRHSPSRPDRSAAISSSKSASDSKPR